jgi:hypothetical protein
MTLSVSIQVEYNIGYGRVSQRTQPKLADGTLLDNGFLDDGFVLSTLGFLFLCKGLVGTALLGCLNLFRRILARVLCLFSALVDFTIVKMCICGSC